MKTYLVDTENTGCRWLPILQNLEDGDRVVLFCTRNSPKISMLDLPMLLVHSDRIETIECSCGHPSELDFQLCAYLGMAVKEDRDTQYIVVSNDHGYDSAIHLVVSSGHKVSRMSVDASAPSVCPDPLCGAAPCADIAAEEKAGVAAEAEPAAVSDISEMFDCSAFRYRDTEESHNLVGCILRMKQKSPELKKVIHAAKTSSTKSEFRKNLCSLCGKKKGNLYYNRLAKHLDRIG